MNLFISMKYLVALDDHRHFGRAALACHVTQPALSNALRALEEGLGISIVKRGRNFAGLTSESDRVLTSARRILREQELLQQDMHSSKGHPQGQLLVGAVPTAMPIAARFVALLQARHPGIVPTLRSLSSVELETGLESLALDMGLGYTERMAGSGSTLRVLPQYTEHYFLLRRAAAGGSNAGSLRAATAMRWPARCAACCRARCWAPCSGRVRWRRCRWLSRMSRCRSPFWFTSPTAPRARWTPPSPLPSTRTGWHRR
jgi:DNA-binding transcriptional LysR family regulator